MVCSNGDRAAHQAKRLAKKGFTRVAYMSGGIKAWCRAGLPVRGTQVR